MNINIDKNKCILVQQEGGKAGRQGMRSAGSPDPATTAASVPSLEAGVGQIQGRRWRRQGRG